MKVKLGTLSRKATAAAIGGALALAGVGVGTAAVLSPTSTAPASDQTEVTEPTATSSAEPTVEPTQAAPVVEQPEQAVPTATVPGVTSNQQPASTQADDPTPDPAATGGTGTDGVYTPAPEPGGLPLPPLPPAPKLPGEDGYTG